MNIDDVTIYESLSQFQLVIIILFEVSDAILGNISIKQFKLNVRRI